MKTKSSASDQDSGPQKHDIFGRLSVRDLLVNIFLIIASGVALLALIGLVRSPLDIPSLVLALILLGLAALPLAEDLVITLRRHT